MTLDKLQRGAGLSKETRQSDNLSDAAARALQTIRQVVLENSQDASLQQLMESFRRALLAYDDSIDTNPAEAARRFGEEISLGQLVERSLSCHDPVRTPPVAKASLTRSDLSHGWFRSHELKRGYIGK
jgi:hypothetical protein